MAPLTSVLFTLLAAAPLALPVSSPAFKCPQLELIPGYGFGQPVVVIDERIHHGSLEEIDAIDVASIEVTCWTPAEGFSDAGAGVPVVLVVTRDFREEHGIRSGEVDSALAARQSHALAGLYRSRVAGDRRAREIPTPACLDREGPAGTGRTFGFSSGDVRMAGRILLPEGDGPHPAVVLLPGGGSDPALLRLAPESMAERFTRCGIAALVYDKRGTGDSGGSYEASDFDDFVADAGAAVDALRDVPGIDRGRVGVMGFSQGGRLAPVVAARRPEVAFAVSLSGPIASVAETRLHALRHTFARAGVPAETLDRVMPLWADHLRAVAADDVDALRAAEATLAPLRNQIQAQLLPPSPDALPRTAIYNSMGGDWHSELDRLSAPWLSLFGENDPVVPVAESIRILEDEMFEGGNDRWAVVVVPNAIHNLDDEETGERYRFEATVIEWIRELELEGRVGFGTEGGARR